MSKQTASNPAVSKLLAAADEVLAMARELLARGRDADCLACATLGASYVRTAQTMQELEDAASPSGK